VTPVEPATIRANPWTSTFRLADIQALSASAPGWTESLVHALEESLRNLSLREAAVLPSPLSGLDRMVEDYAIFGGRGGVTRHIRTFASTHSRHGIYAAEVPRISGVQHSEPTVGKPDI